GGRGDVDDRPAALLTHVRDDVLAGQPHRPQVDVHDPVPRLGLEPVGRGVAGADADVVVEHVDAAEDLDRLGHQATHRVLVGDVGHHDLRPTALGGDGLGRLTGRALVTVDDDHVRALAGE